MKIWQKIKTWNGSIKITQYRFLGFTVLHKEKSEYQKVYRFLGIVFSKKISDSGTKFNKKNIEEYGKWLKDVKTNKSLFVPFTENPYKRKKGDVKIFAYYLSQFHSIPENDEVHGKGFTEWNNVASTTPAFIGHYQPKIPYDLGFYNLLMPEVLRRQVEIAKTYGIYGFCFYYYWFNGTKVLDTPLRNFLNSDIDFHFHFFWANETWSSRWQGGSKDIILEQVYDKEKFEQFFYDMLPYLKDQRYEKINNKPILMIYYPEDMERDLFVLFSDTLNRLARENGFDGMYLTAVFDFKKDKQFLQNYKLDGLTEFYPFGLKNKLKQMKKPIISKEMSLTIHDLHKFIKTEKHLFDTDYDLYKCACPNWDNSPRKLYSHADMYHIEEGDFAKWLKDNIKWTEKHNDSSKQYTYINAWNEWGEGAVLEPTVRYGYKDLQALKDVLESLVNS